MLKGPMGKQASEKAGEHAKVGRWLEVRRMSGMPEAVSLIGSAYGSVRGSHVGIRLASKR